MLDVFKNNIENIRLMEQKRDLGMEMYLKMEYKRK